LIYLGNHCNPKHCEVYVAGSLYSWSGPAITPHTLLTTFEYSPHMTLDSPVDFVRRKENWKMFGGNPQSREEIQPQTQLT
jgi:hypothetical protein